MENDKYIQIIPAPNNLYAVYQEDDGTEYYSKIATLALTKSGDIEILDLDDTGWIDNAKDADNFLRFEYKP